MHSLFLLLLFCLPFELPIVEAAHGLLFDHVGNLYLFVAMGSVLTVVAALTAIASPGARATATYLPMGLTYCGVGFLGLVVTLFACGDLDFALHSRVAVQQAAFGYLAPFLACLAILGLAPAERQRAWRWYYAGFVVYLALSLIPLAMTYRSATSEIAGFSDYSMAERMVRGRGVFDEWNYYLIYIGNTNKTSNYLLISLLFSERLLGGYPAASPRAARWTRRILISFWLLGSFTLLVLLSRLALMLYPIVVLSSGILKHLSLRTKIVAACAVIGGLGYSQFGVLYDYVVNSALPGEEGAGMIGTGTMRFDQWGEICDYFYRNPQQVFFGLGVGTYGELFFQDHVRGTHNMFLDVLLEAGVAGLLLLVASLLMAAIATFDFRAGRLRDPLSAIALAIMLLLMLREHSPAYLYVTSLGGFCFTMIFYAASERSVATVRAPITRAPATPRPLMAGGQSRLGHSIT